MKTIKVTIALLMFITSVMAQNPFKAKSDVIIDFNISPDGESMVYNELKMDGCSNISVKSINTGNVITIHSVDLRRESGFSGFSGVDFIDNDMIVFGKDGFMVSLNLKSRQYSKLFKLPVSSIMFVSMLPDGKKAYFTDAGGILYYADISKSLVLNSTELDGEIISITIDVNGRAVCTTTGGVGNIKIFSYDGMKNDVNDITSGFSNIVSKPYVVECANDEHFIVAGKDGVFDVDTQKGKSVKLMDMDKGNPPTKLRLSADGKIIYYQTMNGKVLSKTFPVDD